MADNRNRTPQSERDRGEQNPPPGQNPGGHNPHHSAIGDRGAKRSQDPGRQRKQDDDVDDDLMDEERDDDDLLTDDRDRGPSGAGS